MSPQLIIDADPVSSPQYIAALKHFTSLEKELKSKFPAHTVIAMDNTGKYFTGSTYNNVLDQAAKAGVVKFHVV